MDHRINANKEQSFLRRNGRFFFALAFFLLLLQDVFGAHGLVAMHRSKKQIEDVQTEINQLGQENQELQQRIQKLKTDPSAIEKIARDRMGLARPGELIFRMPDLNKGKGSQASPNHPATNSSTSPKQ